MSHRECNKFACDIMCYHEIECDTMKKHRLYVVGSVNMNDDMDVDYDPSEDSGLESSTDDAPSETDMETPVCTVAVANSRGGVIHAFLFAGELTDNAVISRGQRLQAHSIQAMVLMDFARFPCNIGSYVHDFVCDPIYDRQVLAIIQQMLW
jgi:hypothetical protein